MPKKVITRRQRKAAEAKLKKQEAIVIPSESPCNNVATVPKVPTAVQPTNCALHNNAEQSKNQTVDVVETEGKTTVRSIVNDQNAKAVADEKRLDEKVNETKVATPPGPLKEQGSFSKTLTRKAAATIKKIQKLSKVLAIDKKLCHKRQKESDDSKVAEPRTLAYNSLDETIKKALDRAPNKCCPCSCEFCKVVLSQLLPDRKPINDKLKCNKHSKQDSEVESEECKLLPSLESRRHILQLLEKKEKQLARGMIKRIKQIGQQPVPLATAQNCKLPMKPNKLSSSSLSEAVSDQESSKAAIKPPQQVTTSRENFLHAIENLGSTPAPVKVIGNTGYFVLTGTNDQLAAQLAELEAHNVLISHCKLLVPGVSDVVEAQLEELDANRQQIVEQMHNKNQMLEPRRERRLKKQSKYH
ncbi:hypothetical protein KR044_001500 [Drosophila immigrans]|nr:hypothetical protein KR044_001500 [Drosophila immigrans]